MKITDVKEKEVVHCQTEAEAIRICNLMHEAGISRSDEKAIKKDTSYAHYGSDTCYYPFIDKYRDYSFYKNKGFKIIPSTEITAEDELVPAPEDLFEPQASIKFHEGKVFSGYARPVVIGAESAKEYIRSTKGVSAVNFISSEGSTNIRSMLFNGDSFIEASIPFGSADTEKTEFYQGEFAEVTSYPFTGKVEVKKVDEDAQKEEPKAERRNEGKLQWSLVDFPSLESMVEVLGFGAEKYSADNWKKGLPVRKQIDSLLRHVTAIAAGVELDEESGLSHIGHAQCNLMFLAWTLKNKPELDDR